MLIEQSVEDLEASRVVGANVTLKDVRLASCRAHSEPPYLLRLEQNSAPEIISTPQGHSFHEEILLLPIDLRLSVGYRESEDFAIRIDCTFEASYTIKAGFEPTPDQIRSFHEANVVFNCWPFFRELVHSFCLRMGHAPVAVPLLRLGLRTSETSNTDEP